MHFESFLKGEFGIEIAIGLLIIFLQGYFYYRTTAKTRILRKIFPHDILAQYKVVASSYAPNITIELPNYTNNELNSIVESINEYLRSSKGASEFEVLKDITNGNIDVLYEEITDRINIPLYTGLMGTFSGIIIGLFSILQRGVINEASIISFIGGILIAMSASFVGLFLTVRSNTVDFKRAKTTCERRKNTFFKFLRTEVLSHSTKGLSEVITAFKENINKFNASFGSNINLFDEKLSGNIKSLAHSVSFVSNNISEVNKNTQSNLEILKILQTENFRQMISSNTGLVNAINNSIPNFTEFFQKQNEINDAVDKTLKLATAIESIMNRVKRFEDGVNALGQRIDNADYMGADLLSKVHKKLEELDKQFELLKQHTQSTAGQIEVHFEAEKKKIEALSLRVLSELQHALQFNIERNPFTKLELLESIDKSLKDTQYKLKAITEMKELQITRYESKGKEKHKRKKKSSLMASIFPFLNRSDGEE